MSAPLASVVVPSRGPADRLSRLLDCLAAQTVPIEAIVVDNASPGGEVSALCDAYPFAEAIRLERNGGFSAPVNLGARRAVADVLILLNDDCTCEPDFAERLAARLDPPDGVVMAAAVMRDLHDATMIDSAGMELDPTLLVYDYLSGEALDSLGPDTPDPIGPSAAAAAFDRDAYLAAGGFDERIFAYWEDVDLVLRLLARGGRCRLAADAIGTHEHSATLGSGSASKNYLMGFGRGYLLRKWGVMGGTRILAVLARELPLLGGQALIDRNLAGLRGRVRGWRAATASHDFPTDAAGRGGGAPLLLNLRRRLERRRRLGARG